MIANLLRDQTSDKHNELESLMFVNEIMNGSLSISDYKKLLTVNYIIHHKLEKKLTDMLDADIFEKLQMHTRYKLTALEKDLDYWAIDPLSLPDLDFELFVPERNNAEVLGALYVLEGATLGGNVIKKQILKNPEFAHHKDGLNYYGVYGDELGSKWKTFVEVLNESVTEADYELCIDSANRTFSNLINLCKQC